MPQRPHSGKRTTQAERRAIRNSDESLKALSTRYGINPKTVAKWKQRTSIADLPRGPKPGQHRKLTAEEESIIVQFREHTLLPLDDCLYALQAQIPHLSRSTMHRCLQRHGVSSLSLTCQAGMEIAQDVSALGDLHIDHAQVNAHDGTYFLFNAIEQASKFVFVKMDKRGDDAAAADFLAALLERHPCKIGRIFTLDAEPFAANDQATEFSRICRNRGIEHCVTKDIDPWSRNPGARMGRMLHDEVIFAGKDYLLRLLSQFVHAYNFRRRLKTLRGKTPYEFLCEAWDEQPEQFTRNPHHELLGLDFAHDDPSPR
jgi:transposase-like protein